MSQLSVASYLMGIPPGNSNPEKPKIIHNFGFVGHIEDIIVHPDYQGYGVGTKIIENLKQYGDEKGCYKCILDCADDKIPFYQKCSFKLKGSQMSYYYARKNQVK